MAEAIRWIITIPPPNHGQQYDAKAHGPAAGLYYMRARFYDPAIGRFINADPLEGTPSAPQSLNRYAYALNNPTNLIDPTGLASEGGALSCLSFAFLTAGLAALFIASPLTGFLISSLLFTAALSIDLYADDQLGAVLESGSFASGVAFEFGTVGARRLATHFLFLDLLYGGGACFRALGKS